MSIDGSNLLTLLSGAGAGGNFSSSALATGSDGAGFSAAFLDQLGALQASLANGGNAGGEALAMLNQVGAQNLPDGAQTAMQNFAALFGKGLPSANAGEQAIDLDDTLQALAEVMQHLQAMETSADKSNSSGTVDVSTATSPDAQQEMDEQQQALAASLLAQAMPTPVAPQAESSPTTPAVVETVESFNTGLTMPAKKPAGFQVVAKHAELPVATNPEQENLALDFDRSIGALLSQNSTEGGAGDKDGQGAWFQGDTLAAQADMPQSADKAMAGIAGDIAKLNQSVRGNVATEVPPMGKHLSDPAWNSELGEKLIWMHKQSIPSAELRLNPEHLGPVLVKIDVSQDQASISFTAQHQGVKEAIEAAIPKLREMFSGHQLELADVNVSQHQSEQRQARDFFQSASEQGRSRRSEGDELLENDTIAGNDIAEEIEAGRAIASNGLLSLFA